MTHGWSAAVGSMGLVGTPSRAAGATRGEGEQLETRVSVRTALCAVVEPGAETGREWPGGPGSLGGRAAGGCHIAVPDRGLGPSYRRGGRGRKSGTLRYPLLGRTKVDPHFIHVEPCLVRKKFGFRHCTILVFI